MKRRTEITIETDRIFIVRRSVVYPNPERQPQPLTWCLECAEQVMPLTPDEAASHFHISYFALFELIESSMVHYIETASGQLLFCPNTVLNHPQEKS